MSSGQAFAALDRLLEETRSGPFYLRQPAIPEMVVDAIRYNAEVPGHYVPHAFVVMPNHVHLLMTPGVALEFQRIRRYIEQTPVRVLAGPSYQTCQGSAEGLPHGD
jgi:hypothetical protein